MLKKLLLIYPRMGMSGTLVCHMPLSLLYASIASLKSGFEIEIVDLRLVRGSWEQSIRSRISGETVLIGISVLSGTPIRCALEISRWIKSNYADLPVVWGGAHALFCGAEILSESAVDYVVSGYGSQPLARLAKYLRGDSDALPLDKISGLVFRSSGDGAIVAVPPEATFEKVSFREIPYHLIENDIKRYGQLDSADIVFPMYTTLGCPYQCTFCSSPAQYREMKCKYLTLQVEEVVDHIEFVHRRYGATYIYFIDDDSFVDLDHAEAIIDEIKRRDIMVKLGFRGARIDEILRMDTRYLVKLADAGTSILHIGAESGSQRMLDLMGKNTKVADILEVNRRLARQPQITAAYNWIIGLPGETIEDLADTRWLVMKILDENPYAIIFAPNKYRPLPGTELYETAVKYGYAPPADLEGWGAIEVEGDFISPWYSDEFVKMVNMMQVTSYFIDDKLEKIPTGNTFKYFAARCAGRLYAPLAKFRYRNGVTSFFLEFWIFRFIVNMLRG